MFHKTIIPNPDLEAQFRVQVIDVPKEFTKTGDTGRIFLYKTCMKYSTLLVIRLFVNFLGALRACTIIVISKSGLGIIELF